MLQRARLRRAAERPQIRRVDPPAPTVEPPPDAGGSAASVADFSIATLDVLPEVTPVARKIQRQESDDRHPAPAPSPASPPNPPGDGGEQLDTSGQGSTTILAPTVAFKVYSGKTLQDVSNQLPPEAGSLTFDIGTASDGDPITRATVTIKQAMELPRWAERDAQCKPIQASWDRFISALRQHENEHVKINKQQLGKAHERYVGKAQSETQDVTTELENETDAAGKAFDAQTDHGRTATPSTTIDLGAKCSDKTTTGEPGPEPEELQAKLEVSEPGDPDEEEADRVAEQVMRMADPRAGAPLRLVAGASVVQRCAACEEEEEKHKNLTAPDGQRVRRKCAECEAKEKEQERVLQGEEKDKQRVARKEANGRSSVNASSRVVDVTKSGGQPLDAETRAYMEPRFGYDFSRVRIHADGEAAIAARSVNAHAYTLGDSVVFGAGRYAPATTDGRRLLAHELAHVVQQGADAGVVSRRIQRALDMTKGEPIRKELDATFYSNNATIEDLFASLGKELPEAINNRQPVTLNPAEKGLQKGKKESYADLWWRSIADEGIDVARAGRHVAKQFQQETLALARGHVDTQHRRFKQLEEELKNAKQQKSTPAPPTSSQATGVEDDTNKVSRKVGPDPKLKTDPRTLVDSATLLHFLLNWEELLKNSPIGTLRKDNSRLLPTPGGPPAAGGFNPFPNAPPSTATGSADAASPGAPATPSPTEVLTFKPPPDLTVEKILSMPQLEYFDAEAFAELQKTFRECSEKRGMFKEFAERMMQEDAALAALATAPGNLLGQVSALGGHSDEVAGDAMIRMAGENAKASEKFRDMIDRGEVDWLLLRPVWSDLLNGGNGGRWTSATARGFIDADFKKRKEEEERKALLQTAATVGVAAVTLLAMATPLGPIGAAFFIAVDALTVASSVAEASAAAKKAEVTGAGAAAGVISKDDASRAKEEADAKQSGMVFDIVFAALPYVGHVAKGAGKAAGAIGRSARWAKAARGAEEMKNLGNLQKTTKEVTAADQAINKISGIPDAKDSGVFHELKYGPHGPERCTHCELFGNSLSDRGKFVQKTAGATDRLKTRTMYIQARANSISARAREIEKLPEAARRTKESALLREAYELEMHMVEIEHEALGITSGRLPAQHKGRWSNPETPGTGIWYPNEGHPAFAYCGTKGIPYHNGYPQFSTLALKGGEVNLLPGQKVLIGGSQRDVGMVGKMSDFEVADAMAAQMTGMKDATAFREWRLDKGFTWHHRENGVTMQLVPTALHASIPHIGGASFQRGIPVK